VAGELILIVEDNLRNLKLARDLLQIHGFRTVEATSAVDAVSAAETHLPHLILLDIQLPDGDGISVLARLRGDPMTARIPVVALTAFAMSGDRERFIGAGFSSYISKPIAVMTFAATVQQLCDDTSVREPA